MRRRTLRSGLAVLVVAVLTLLFTAGPALAAGHAGDPAAPPVGLAKTLLLFVLTPGAIVVVISGLVWLPGTVRGTRYRPGRGWSAAPVWFAGPADPAIAVASAQVGDLARGGAHGDW